MKQTIQGIHYLDNTPIAVEIDELGVITRITRLDSVDTSGFLTIAPGLVDAQINGCVSVEFTAGDLTVEGVRKVMHTLWREGVTTFLPTLITAPEERLEKNFKILTQAIADREIGLCIPGFHLEGPFISPEDGFRGAHNKEYVRKPAWDEFLRLYEITGGKILQVTVAPEMEGAIDFIRKCSDRGIVVGLGHHNASTEIIQQAVDAGADLCVHLGNGCANMIHRHNNPLWPQLAEDRLMISLIVDGIHLLPEEVKTFYKVKGPDYILLISDMTRLAGMPPGPYEWDGKQVVLTPEGMIKYPEQNVLAGASLPLRRGIEHMMKFTNCTLAEAVHMASKNPAALFRLHDRGELQPGKRADLILFKLQDGELEIHQTLLKGDVVYQRK